MRHIISLLILTLFLSIPAALADVNITGDSAASAQLNATVIGSSPNKITVTAWNTTTTKTFWINVVGSSVVINFTIGNNTAGRVMELKVNGTSVNAYKVNSTGYLVFSRTQGIGNQTYSVAPAINQNGYNFTWIQSDTPIWMQNENMATTFVRSDNTSYVRNTTIINGSGTTYRRFENGSIAINTTTPNNRTNATRILNTVYQAGSTPIIITASFDLDGGDAAVVETGDQNPPTARPCTVYSSTNSIYQTCTVIVLPFEYFALNGAGGSPTIIKVTEWIV